MADSRGTPNRARRMPRADSQVLPALGPLGEPRCRLFVAPLAAAAAAATATAAIAVTSGDDALGATGRAFPRRVAWLRACLLAPRREAHRGG